MGDMIYSVIEVVTSALMPIILTLMVWIGKRAGSLVNSNIRKADNEWLEAIALRMVMWADDFMKDRPGVDKLEAAVSRVLEHVNSKKEIISPDDAYRLVRQAFKGFSIAAKEGLTPSKK